ncbi:thymidylate kinase [Athalia rosae]|uniref:thymidylate kinase n=1 Tax=Athalia rosae TaxID=37344 RepID=UPI00203440B1|nr:thymidylate kinase [Athalia rosae]
MTSKRGALLVLEGCDRAGKSTQVKKLVDALNLLGISAEARRFPDRTTVVGKLIDQFLSRNEELPFETVHLLFSSNRWECSTEIIKTLNSGITLVVDRYAASGAAYTAATTGRDLFWCREPDRGLPQPDLVALLEVDTKSQMLRSDWGKERFDCNQIQQKVAANLRLLMDETWVAIDGNDDLEKIHNNLVTLALAAIDRAKNQPVKMLYSKEPLPLY